MDPAQHADADAAERRWTSGAWLIVGGIALYTLFELWSFGFAATRTTDGCLIQQGTDDAQMIQSCVGDWPTPLREGDEVLAVNGRSLRLDVFSVDAPPPPADWIAGGQGSYLIRRDGVEQTLDVPLHRPGWRELLRLLVFDLPNLLTSTLILLVTATAFALRPGSAATRLLLLSLGTSVIGQSFAGPSSLISQTAWDFWPTTLHWRVVGLLSLVAGWLTLPALLLLLLSFPRRVWPVSRWPRASAVLIFAGGGLAALVAVWTRTFVPFLIQLGLYAVCTVAAFFAATIGTAARVRDPVVRAQAAWLGFGFAIFCSQIMLWLATLAFPAFGAWFEARPALQTVISQAMNLVLPICVVVAILRYRLFDIDIIINRTLVYLALTACVIGTYVLVVGYLGRMLRVEDDLTISLVATGMVAILFQPLRERFQRAVNRLMYGERDDPYGVLAGLGRRLEGTIAREAMLPTIVSVVTETLRLPYAAITMRQGDEQVLAATAGTTSPVALTLPLTYQGAEVGALHVAPRAGEELGVQDRRLLADLARQAGVAVHAVRLTADLQRSRERIVTAREEERRRLRRDLHDGLGPRLAGLTLRVETARERLGADPETDVLLADLGARMEEAVADIRRLVYGLRPPALDDLGLVGALRQAAGSYDGVLDIQVAAPEHLPPLPAAVEVAAFRIAQEALTNVVRHAGASHCVISLEVDEPASALRLAVEDDGRGLVIERPDGVGLHSMRERAAELGGTLVVEPRAGGGTRVRAELPCRPIAGEAEG